MREECVVRNAELEGGIAVVVHYIHNAYGLQLD